MQTHHNPDGTPYLKHDVAPVWRPGLGVIFGALVILTGGVIVLRRRLFS